jgi:hypothetical protein
VTAQDVDVQGTGFLNYAFNASANTGAHVYLVDGVYNGNTGTGNTVKANGAVADCGNVLVISDNELICSLNLTAMMNTAGTGVVASGYRSIATASVTQNSNIITVSGSARFNANDVGEPVVQSVGTDIPANTTIVAVLSPTTAVMSANAASTPSSPPITVTIGSQSSSITAAGTQSNFTVQGNAGVFSQADIGKAVTGTNVGTNAVVVAVNDTGTTATLSVANAGAVSAVTLESGNPVPDGAYNLALVSNAANNAAATDQNYTQTIVSSESTFTVAPF